MPGDRQADLDDALMAIGEVSLTFAALPMSSRASVSPASTTFSFPFAVGGTALLGSQFVTAVL